MFFGNFKRRIDKYGRILIPKKLRNDDFKNGVVVVGREDHIEIWSEEQWKGEKLKIEEALAKVL